jgi:TetR/AcrR family transcriptional repressor of nem operon
MAANTKHLLLAAAETLVRRQGYAGFSYADLAAVMGITKASIHYHFRAKEDLGVALIAAYDARYKERMTAILDATQDAAERIEGYGQLYLEGLESGGGCLAAALATEIDVLPQVFRDSIASFFASHLAWLTDVVSQGQIQGMIVRALSAETYARMILSTLGGALILDRVLGGNDGLRGTLDYIRRSILVEPGALAA